MWQYSQVSTVCVWASTCVSEVNAYIGPLCVCCMRLCACPLGSMSLSIRVKGLQKNRWFSRVYHDPLSRNAKCVRESLHKLSVNMCVSVFVCASQTCSLAKMCACGCAVLYARGMHVCESVCEAIGIPSPPAIRGQTDPIMCVLGGRISSIPFRLAACWCSFQPFALHCPLHGSDPRWCWSLLICWEVCLDAAPQH